MRVVLAPDCFTGTASAAEAATALAAGWRSVAPADSLVLRPVSDGGPGLVDTLAASLPGSRTPVPGLLLAAGVGYVESAVGCGPQAMAAAGRDVRTGSTDAVGRLVAAAAAMAGVHTVVVGLGGSATNDGGAGLWAALGAEPADPLLGGGIGLSRVSEVSVPALPGVRLVAATDVDNPLLGLYGASAVYGPAEGRGRRRDHGAGHRAGTVGRRRGGGHCHAGARDPRPAPAPPAVWDSGCWRWAPSAPPASTWCSMRSASPPRSPVPICVVTGEGRYDATSLRGKAVSGVAAIAQQAGVPCVVAAGQADIGAREAAAHGLDEVWTVAEQLGSADAAIRAGADGLTVLGAAMARTWSR